MVYFCQIGVKEGGYPLMNYRKDVEEYIQKEYHGKIEYPWIRFPSYGVFRHADNQKWYALIMDLDYSRLGLSRDGIVDVLNVKLGDLLLRDLLLQQEGILPGYHISRSNWISILLDGTVPLNQICSLIDTSYVVTASAKTKKALRPPKEWIIPSNPKYYDIVHAFDNTNEISWKQGTGIKVGDTVFMYVGAPVSAVLYKCVVTQTDIPWRFRQDKLVIMKLMKIRLLRRYNPSRFTFEVLQRDYQIFAVRGPRGIPHNLSEALR